MKKLLFAYLLIPTLSLAQHDFRSVDWAMTRSQVLAAEISLTPISVSTDYLTYQDVLLADKRFHLEYAFQNNKLVRASYRKTNASGEPVLMISELEKVLIKKYGEPLKSFDLDKLASTMGGNKAYTSTLYISKYMKVWDRPLMLVVLLFDEQQLTPKEKFVGKYPDKAITVSYIYKLADSMEEKLKELSTKNF